MSPNLGQYYTRSSFSDLLVYNINSERPDTVLELGAGTGSLIRSATNRWASARFIATDIDPKNVNHLTTNMPHVVVHRINSLNANINSRLKIRLGSVDVAICNPPYIRLKKSNAFNRLFDEAALAECKNLPFVTSDLIFLAQNLRLLRTGGQLGIILPDTLIAGREFALFRKSLIDSHCISKIIELPPRIFANTDAQTHIIVIEKRASKNQCVELLRSNEYGVCDNQMIISSEKLIERMDFKFHSYFSTQTPKSAGRKLKDLQPIIRRGVPSYKTLRNSKDAYLHTTNFPCQAVKVDLHGRISKLARKSYLITKAGDILLARVGRNCVGKVCLIDTGAAVLSDCIISIRVPKEVRNLLYADLASNLGQAWLKNISHGVCAKSISKSDLLEFPISF